MVRMTWQATSTRIILKTRRLDASRCVLSAAISKSGCTTFHASTITRTGPTARSLGRSEMAVARSDSSGVVSMMSSIVRHQGLTIVNFPTQRTYPVWLSDKDVSD